MSGTIPGLVKLTLWLVGLGCWVVMFLAGTDVWHDTGRPDFWNLPGAPYHDLRAFVVAFYVLAGGRNGSAARDDGGQRSSPDELVLTQGTPSVHWLKVDV